MTHFERMQALWNQQPGPHQPPAAEAIMTKADTSSKQLRATHRWTMLTLSATVLLVGGYCWVYGTTTNQSVFVGSLLMIGSLLLRIGIEYSSYRQLIGLTLNTDLRTCLEQTRSFHRVRQRIQWVVTPLSLGSYVWGFTMLLPYIKAGVSPGFYTYIILSGGLSLLVLGFIIYQQIRREMRLLAQLEESYATLLTD